jgi:hypothetical protein
MLAAAALAVVVAANEQLWQHVKLLKDQEKIIKEKHNMLRIDIYPTKFHAKMYKHSAMR